MIPVSKGPNIKSICCIPTQRGRAHMSLDQRCQQFHEVALAITSANAVDGQREIANRNKSKAPKEVSTLRKFLHRNQDQRFTDRAICRLFDTIQLYYHSSQVDQDSKEGLLEDSLKMPFTLFSAKQKQTMLKWLEDLRCNLVCAGNNSESGDGFVWLSVIDVTEDALTLLNDDSGETYEIPTPDGDLGKSIRDAYELGDHVVMVKTTISKQGVNAKILDVRVDR